MNNHEKALVFSFIIFLGLVGVLAFQANKRAQESRVTAYTLYNNEGSKNCTALVNGVGRIVGGDCGISR